MDAYLEKAPEFARPVLGHLRAMIRAGCPDAEETIKWGRPTFVYKGRILCGMVAFQAHCGLGFWQSEMADLIAKDSHGSAEDASGQFGRITSLADLPDDATLRHYIATAVRMLEAGKPARESSTPKPRRAEIPVPPDFARLLAAQSAAAAAFAGFSPSHRREYLEWIVEAKREETRARRMATAIEWLAQGKPRNWKHIT